MDHGFFTESGNDLTETTSIGSFHSLNQANTFDKIYQEAVDAYEQTYQTQFGSDFLNITSLKNDAKVATFKENLLEQLATDVRAFTESAERRDEEFYDGAGPGVGHVGALYEEVSRMFDTKIDDLITEATNVGTLMPIKTIDIPVMVKAHINESFNNVVNTEVTPSLVIKKRIEHSIAYDKKDPTKQWEYPQCFYDDSFRDMMKAGQGVSLDTKACTLPLNNFNIVEELTSAPISVNQTLVTDLKIVAVDTADDQNIKLPQPMQVNLADGMWLGGKLDFEYTVDDGAGNTTKKKVQDVITGFTDWATNTTNLSHTNTTDGVVAVHFLGKLSNDGNEHTIRTKYIQEDREFKIGEGTKVDASFSLEELQNHKAMLHMDLYQKAYNDLVVLLSNMEDSDGYDWLDVLHDEYKGLDMDPLQWNPLVMETSFDLDSSYSTVALQSEYIAKELKFKIDRFIIDIADTVKLDGLNFVIYGNPRYISLLQPFVKWVFRTGQSAGGVKLDHSYGVMTSGDVNVYIVSSKKINAKKHKGIRFIPFTTDKETITFKKWKFSTDVVTSKESAYKDTEKAGGSMTYVWGQSRYTQEAIQAIFGDLTFDNLESLISIK